MIGGPVGQSVEYGWPIKLGCFLQDERLQRTLDRVSPNVLCFKGKSQSLHDFFGGSEPLKSHLQKIQRSRRLHHPAPDRPAGSFPPSLSRAIPRLAIPSQL